MIPFPFKISAIFYKKIPLKIFLHSKNITLFKLKYFKIYHCIMNKKKIILLLLLFQMTLLFGQENYKLYYQATAKAFSFMAMKDYDNAIKTYEQAFKEFYPFPDDLKYLKDCFLAQKDTLSAYHTVRRMIACGWQLEEKPPIIDEKNTIVNNIGLGNPILEQKIKEEYAQLRADYLKNINHNDNQYIENLILGETFAQAMRSRIWQNSKQYSKRQMEMIIDEGFRTNSLLLINTLNKKNFPRKDIAAWNGQLIEITLIHAVQSTPKKDFNHIMSLLKKEVEKGNIHPIVYATIYDACRCLNHKMKFSYYGQYAEGFFSNKPQCVNVEDVEHVDERRAAIGLPPLWAWCDYYKIAYPKNYKPNK